jgi:catechol 2,3-dioxygenase-like lactoylglutathione lyase family enzyme
VRPEDQYHVGIVVNDLDAAKEFYTVSAGYRWCDEMRIENVFVAANRETAVSLRFTYSREAPRIELVESIPGTLFAASSPHVHHVGYWSDDIDGDIATLEAAGALLEGRGFWPDGRGPIWAYVTPPNGSRIELVDKQAKPSMEQWWATGTRGG